MKKVLFFTILSIIELTLIMLIIFFPTIRTYMVITAITIFLTSGVIYKNIFSNNKTGEVDLLEDGYEINHVLDYIEESILSGKEVTKGNLIHLANEMLQSIRGFDLTTISSNDTALFDFLLFMFEDLKTKLDKTKIDAHGFELYTDCVKEVMLEVARKENLIISNINELIDRRVMFYKAYCGNNVDSFLKKLYSFSYYKT